MGAVISSYPCKYCGLSKDLNSDCKNTNCFSNTKIKFPIKKC